MSPVASPWQSIPVIVTQGGSTITPGEDHFVPNLAAAVAIIRPECDAGDVLLAEVSAALANRSAGMWIAEIGEGSDVEGYAAVIERLRR